MKNSCLTHDPKVVALVTYTIGKQTCGSFVFALRYKHQIYNLQFIPVSAATNNKEAMYH